MIIILIRIVIRAVIAVLIGAIIRRLITPDCKSLPLRTLILPPFYKHNRNDESSEGHDPIAEPAMRVDISALRQYVSTIEGKEAAEGICERSFDVIFFGGKSYCKQSRVESISNYTGFTDFVPRGNEKMKKGDGKKGMSHTV